MNVGEILATAKKNTYLVGVGPEYGDYIGVRSVEPAVYIHGEIRLALKAMASKPHAVGIKPLVLTSDTAEEFTCRSIGRTYTARLYEDRKHPVYVFVAIPDRNRTPERMSFFDYSRDILQEKYGLSGYFAGRVGHVIECNKAKDMEMRISSFRIEFEHTYSEDILSEVERYMRSFAEK